jgi:hypothetical protein
MKNIEPPDPEHKKRVQKVPELKYNGKIREYEEPLPSSKRGTTYCKRVLWVPCTGSDRTAVFSTL